MITFNHGGVGFKILDFPPKNDHVGGGFVVLFNGQSLYVFFWN